MLCQQDGMIFYDLTNEHEMEEIWLWKTFKEALMKVLICSSGFTFIHILHCHTNKLGDLQTRRQFLIKNFHHNLFNHACLGRWMKGEDYNIIVTAL